MNQANTCPDWASSLLVKLRSLEVELGNILDQDQEYLEKKLIEIATNKDKIVGSDFEDGLTAENLVELIFKQVVQGLFNQNFSIEQITIWINLALCPKGGMPYCNEQEVKSVLE